MDLATRSLHALAAFIILAACASSDIERVEATSADKALTQPKRIVIGEFTAAPERLPNRPEIKAHFDERDEPVSADEIELGRQLGERVSANLVKELTAMGIAAVRKQDAGDIALHDGLIEGYFVTVDQGNRLKRMLIGFGAGASELKTLVEVYQMGESGLNNLGFAEVQAEGGKLPGMLVPVGAGAAADELARSVIVSGGISTAKELGPESIEAAADRTASEIADLIKKGYEKRGWL